MRVKQTQQEEPEEDEWTNVDEDSTEEEESLETRRPSEVTKGSVGMRTLVTRRMFQEVARPKEIRLTQLFYNASSEQ